MADLPDLMDEYTKWEHARAQVDDESSSVDGDDDDSSSSSSSADDDDDGGGGGGREEGITDEDRDNGVGESKGRYADGQPLARLAAGRRRAATALWEKDLPKRSAVWEFMKETEGWRWKRHRGDWLVVAPDDDGVVPMKQDEV